MIIYDPEEVTEYEIETVRQCREFELLIQEMSDEIDDAREKHGEDVSLMFDFELLQEVSQAITNLQNHIHYNEKLRAVRHGRQKG